MLFVFAVPIKIVNFIVWPQPPISTFVQKMEKSTNLNNAIKHSAVAGAAYNPINLDEHE